MTLPGHNNSISVGHLVAPKALRSVNTRLSAKSSAQSLKQLMLRNTGTYGQDKRSSSANGAGGSNATSSSQSSPTNTLKSPRTPINGSFASVTSPTRSNTEFLKYDKGRAHRQSHGCLSALLRRCLILRLRTLFWTSLFLSIFVMFFVASRARYDTSNISQHSGITRLTKENTRLRSNSNGLLSKDVFVQKHVRRYEERGQQQQQQLLLQEEKSLRRTTNEESLLVPTPTINITVARRFSFKDYGRPIMEYDDDSLVRISKPLPVIVLGYPKSGTTSIWNFFNCSGVLAQHYCAYGDLQDAPPCSKATMAECVLYNLAEGRPVLEGCGRYQVYAQIDGERPKNRGWGSLFENGSRIVDAPFGHFLPQHFNLDEIHRDYPSATFVLPLRPPLAWVKSVMNWFYMKRWVINEYKMRDPSVLAEAHRANFIKASLQRIYEHHTQTVREFVRQHPSHAFVEVDITDPNAGAIMSEAFGLSETCWGHHNKKEEHDKIVKKLRGIGTVKDQKDQKLESPNMRFPIINVGYPLSGSAELWSFLTCGGVNTQQSCGYRGTIDASSCEQGSMVECILENMADERAMLEGCGDFQAYIQIDGERPRHQGLGMLPENETRNQTSFYGYFLPQQHHLDRLCRENLNATFILPIQDPEEWAVSILGFHSLKKRIINEYMFHDSSIQFPDYGEPRKAFLMKIYQEHIEHVQQVFSGKQNNLLIVNISDFRAGSVLSAAFGVQESCWVRNISIADDLTSSDHKTQLDLNKIGDLAIANAVEREKQQFERKNQLQLKKEAELMARRKSINLPEPVINVGFPKSGTREILNFFNCSQVVTQHYCAYGELNYAAPCKRGTMASCILHNMAASKPPLEGCGDYQVYAQIDGERPKQRNHGTLFENGTRILTAPFGHFLPQIFNLDEIHKYYPQATFVLPLRDSREWAQSIIDWHMMKRWLINEYMSKNSSLEFESIGYGESRLAFFAEMYDEHTRNVRNFIRKNSSHRLVEVNISDASSRKFASNAFGLDEKCWGNDLSLEDHGHILKNTTKIGSTHVDLLQGNYVPSQPSPFKKELPLPLPVIVVGFPKSGTTSVYNFFSCSGVVTQHYCAYGDTSDTPPCEKGTMAECILMNMAEGNKLLHGCGDYQVYAQIDGERPRNKRQGAGVLFENGTRIINAPYSHFLPQHFNLDQIHNDYPYATFVLPLREPQVWAYSVMHWFMMKRWIINEYMTKNTSITFDDIGYGDDRRNFLAKIYHEHTEKIRSFVQKHPTHRLVEVNITDPLAGTIMADAFDLDANCWGHHNKKEDHDKIANVVNSKLTKPKETF